MHCPHTLGHVMYKRVNFSEQILVPEQLWNTVSQQQDKTY